VDTSLRDVLNLMMENNIVRVPVTKKDRLVGIIARCDILRSVIAPKLADYK